MSYGWLTESSLLPKKSKSIKVDDASSLFGLKAVMLREKQKMKQSGVKKPIYEAKSKVARNAGIEQRMKRDEVVSNAVENKIRDGTRALHVKEKVYKQLQEGKQNVNRLLVDFEGKALEKDDGDEYQRDREQFYAGKLQELKKQREETPTQTFGEKDFRERIAWEKEVLGQLSGSVQEKEKVRQVFDKKMHADEKQALTQVLKELSYEEKLIQEARKRREQIKQQRIMKLKRLNILIDSPAVPETTKKQSQQKDELIMSKNEPEHK